MKSQVQTWAVGLLRGGRNVSNFAAIGGRPRFVPTDQKLRRLKSYRVVIPLGSPGAVVTWRRVEEDGEPLVLHGVGSNGRLRLYSRRQGSRRPQAVAPAQIRSLTGLNPRRGRQNPDRINKIPTTSLEAAALALIEQGRIVDACDVLLGGCRITYWSTKPNVRLFDLLALLSIRFSEAAHYRAALTSLVASGSWSSGSSPWADRVEKWRSDRWIKRRRDAPFVSWGHPLDRVVGRRHVLNIFGAGRSRVQARRIAIGRR